MHYLKDADYRRRLAAGFLKEADEDFVSSRWRACVDNAQLSVENSGKAVIALFRPVEKTHDPSVQLKKLIEEKIVPEPMIAGVEELTVVVSRLGAEEHFMTDYGDEETGRDPWQIFTSDDARKALADAHRAFALSSGICVKLLDK